MELAIIHYFLQLVLDRHDVDVDFLQLLQERTAPTFASSAGQSTASFDEVTFDDASHAVLDDCAG